MYTNEYTEHNSGQTRHDPVCTAVKQTDSRQRTDTTPITIERSSCVCASTPMTSLPRWLTHCLVLWSIEDGHPVWGEFHSLSAKNGTKVRARIRNRNGRGDPPPPLMRAWFAGTPIPVSICRASL